ncbi:hypothetical protein AVEN_150973-1 [Araneus ventricosus]|uniref:Uncharacterized protein n=1 Tax=Araneus ventricosus TaxID=182803 RepID=A0A4Y2SLA0_ARAVE|nr:hypothetical protein AVEN_150973-1 [Araneus ventricosus]
MAEVIAIKEAIAYTHERNWSPDFDPRHVISECSLQLKLQQVVRRFCKVEGACQGTGCREVELTDSLDSIETHVMVGKVLSGAVPRSTSYSSARHLAVRLERGKRYTPRRIDFSKSPLHCERKYFA